MRIRHENENFIQEHISKSMTWGELSKETKKTERKSLVDKIKKILKKH